MTSVRSAGTARPCMRPCHPSPPRHTALIRLCSHVCECSPKQPAAAFLRAPRQCTAASTCAVRCPSSQRPFDEPCPCMRASSYEACSKKPLHSPSLQAQPLYQLMHADATPQTRPLFTGPTKASTGLQAARPVLSSEQAPQGRPIHMRCSRALHELPCALHARSACLALHAPCMPSPCPALHERTCLALRHASHMPRSACLVYASLYMSLHASAAGLALARSTALSLALLEAALSLALLEVHEPEPRSLSLALFEPPSL